jgi:hypothetical protein
MNTIGMASVLALAASPETFANRSNGDDPTCHQLRCQAWQLIISAIRPAILDGHVVAFGVSGLAQTLPKGIEMFCRFGRRPAAEEANHWYSWLLRPRSERPRHYRAAYNLDEFASPHRPTPQTKGLTLPCCALHCASRKILVANVRFGSKADMAL